MPYRVIDPSIFDGAPWTMKPTWPTSKGDDWVVIAAGIKLGRIMLHRRSGNEMVWAWHISTKYPDQKPRDGMADTLDEAKVQFKAAFDQWLPLAKVSPKESWCRKFFISEPTADGRFMI